VPAALERRYSGWEEIKVVSSRWVSIESSRIPFLPPCAAQRDAPHPPTDPTAAVGKTYTSSTPYRPNMCLTRRSLSYCYCAVIILTSTKVPFSTSVTDGYWKYCRKWSIACNKQTLHFLQWFQYNFFLLNIFLFSPVTFIVDESKNILWSKGPSTLEKKVYFYHA